MHLRSFSYVVFSTDSESVFSDFLSCLEPEKLELKVFQIINILKVVCVLCYSKRAGPGRKLHHEKYDVRSEKQ